MSNEEIKKAEFLNACQEQFKEYKETVYSCTKPEEMQKLSSAFYKTIKLLSLKYYKEQQLPYEYRYLAQDIQRFENLFMPIEYITTIPNHNFSRLIDRPRSSKNHEAILDYIVDQTRNYLYEKLSLGDRYDQFEKFDLQDECLNASNFAFDCAVSMDVPAYEVVVYPCFKKNSGVMFGGAHVFLLVDIEDKRYLVDCTYSQFFIKSRCNLDRLGTPLLRGPSPGTFAKYDPLRQMVADTILSRGWIEFTSEVMKAYFDGFTLSIRNGLYYERTGDFSCKTPYDSIDYNNFLFGKDRIFNYERKEELGYQLKPLKDPAMKIRFKPNGGK